MAAFDFLCLLKGEGDLQLERIHRHVQQRRDGQMDAVSSQRVLQLVA